ncbi:hypothetical protein EPO04_02350 [Patescibacteria group bacterium]|nr:MAG: hypothetical protein EPO04_02350 [Patescibacteria group bacterium]
MTQQIGNNYNNIEVRDEIWLQQLLDDTWDRYFSEVPQANIVRIVFGKRAKRQLGSIRLDPKEPNVTIITMNGLFRDPTIPSFVVESTLVHELIHYSHGFNSPLDQLHKHPHAGGVVRKEYAERGLEQLYLDQQKWLKANWPEIVRRNFAPPKPRRRIRRGIPKPFWFVG